MTVGEENLETENPKMENLKTENPKFENPKIEELAREILSLAQSRLAVDLRFLCRATQQFNLSSVEKGKMDGLMATDGKMLCYAAEKVVRAFREEQHMPVRMLLHLTLHCMLGHPFRGQDKERRLWNLASDVAVEKIIHQLALYSCSLEGDEGQQEWLSVLEEYCPHMTAEEVYQYFLDRGLDEVQEEKLARLFEKDSHFLWNFGENGRGGSRKGKKDGNDRADGDNKNRSEEDEAEDEEEVKASEEMLRQSGEDETEEKLKRRQRRMLQKEWKEIAKQAEADLKTFSKRYGQQAGALMDGLAPIIFEECDYSEFLRRFGGQHEVMQLSEDEFDMIYYTYGLKKYGNIPLIEPLEFRDDKRIKEFVIAIDTSGSVQGDIVQNFLQKTCDVLRHTGSFTEQVKIYLIQCDAQIQHIEEIESLDDLEDVIAGLRLSGFGGTDFRPVFDYVDGLVGSGELTELNGLIYFTDGAGMYPEKKPEYKTAFVFHRDDYISPHVPYWAIRAVLTTDNIRVLNSE